MREQDLFGARAWPSWNISRSGNRLAGARGIVVLALFLVWPFWTAAHAAVQPHAGPVHVAAVVVTVVYGASWIVAMAYGIGRPPSERMVLVGWLFALGVGVAALRGNPVELGHLAYALTAAVWLLPARWGLLLGLVVAVAQLTALLVTTGSVDWSAALAVIPSTVTPVALVLLIRLLIQLSQAREEIETLATAAERARLARDLHDVLGHSLTTITVKAGLARRLLESGTDHERAVTELHDVERLSRQAHAEIRTTVSGHRRPSLAVELVGAREALRAAGIEATLPPATDHVPADLREPFAYVLREGVTNVIRHSGALRCEIRLGDSSLEIRDNGRSPARSHGSGNGLSGLAERLRAVDGRIEAGPLPQGGFRLRASRA
ncbi:histidine kinase [Streptosporangium sp. NBC_01639]|uniref:sensor histidine kinase n=1 Tax=Streptosporangium sp. NBC_01639 TaxID=2975948 RepID=UPI00386326F6|nr:histidine kinase [Streptosporangium sp. NBC_01639]